MASMIGRGGAVRIAGTLGAIALVLSFGLMPACTSREAVRNQEAPAGGGPAAPVARGDLAAVLYTLVLEDGSLVATNRPEDLERPRSAVFEPEAPMMAEDVLVGGGDRLPPGIHETLVGMRVGERRRVDLAPEQAFGSFDPSRRQAVSSLQRVPKAMAMPLEAFSRRFGKAPEPGDTVRIVPEVPFFPYRILEVGEGQVRMEAMARDGEAHDTTFGVLRVTVREGDILLDLEPRIGAPIQIEGRRGRIVATEGRYFIVDFNHPLAGRMLKLDMEVVGHRAAALFEGASIPWAEDPDACQERAFLEDRPQVVVLHREGCSWCDKLFSETMEDPRVTYLADRFVWCRVDTGNDADLRSRFRQDGTPNVIVLNPEGEIVARQDSYLPAADLNRLLRGALMLLEEESPQSKAPPP